MRHQWYRPVTRFNEDSPEVNLTPLIDIVFVILIMFIVIAPLLELDQVQLASGPDTATEHTLPVTENAPISIHVKQDNTVYLNSIPVGIEVLESKLIEERSRHPTAVPQLFHDKTAHFGIYQQVKNAAEMAGFSELDVILTPSGKAGAP